MRADADRGTHSNINNILKQRKGQLIMFNGLLTNKITLADGTELEGKYVVITNGFVCVYDAPGDTHYFYYSASMIKTIEIGEAEEEPEEITEG